MLNRPGQIMKMARRRVVESAAEAGVGLFARSRRAKRSIVRRLFAQHLANNLKVLVDFDDHSFVVAPKDTAVSFTLMEGKPWQRDELTKTIELLRQTGRLRTDGVYFDVGANIGTQTVYAILSGAFARAVAVEPEPENFELLNRNISLNSMSERVHISCSAASDQCGSVQLTVDPHNLGAHSISREPRTTESRSVRVKTSTLDAICSTHRVAPEDVGLVWIDVEGHELSVLEGMATLRREKVLIVVEFDGLAHGASGTAKLKQFLRSDYDVIEDLRTILRCDLANAGVPVDEFAPPVGVRDLLIY